MSERYIKVFSGNENLYIEDSPIIIRANALLKDTETGKMIAQLKFQNVSGKSISYVKIAITQLDAIKNPLENAIFFEYLDLSVSDKEEFGSKKPIVLPNLSTRAFNASVSHVGFIDGTVWTTDNTNWQSAKEGSSVLKMLEAESIYKTAVILSKGKTEEDVEKAKKLFKSISKIKDISIELALCEEKINLFEAQKSEKQRKRKEMPKKIFIAFSVMLTLVLVCYFIAYPLIATANGNYSVYINMYNIKEFEVPSGVNSINSNAFFECSSLTNVAIPEGITSIGYKAFYGCSLLTNIIIPEGVTSIGDNAFTFCFSLTNVTIPSSVTYIGDNIFQGCNKFESVTFNGTKEQWNAIEKNWVWNTVYCIDGKIIIG